MYVVLNTKRLPHCKGPTRGKVTLFISKDGRVAVNAWPLGRRTGLDVWIPRWLGELLCTVRLANKNGW